MTSCDKYQTGIVALFDNEADDEALRVAAGHLQGCAQCRAFYMDLTGIRRGLTSASIPSLSPAVRRDVLDTIKTDPSQDGQLHRLSNSRPFRFARLGRWAAVLAIALLSIACFALGRSANDLRTRLGVAEQQVAAIHEQAEIAESKERQQKAISALYFRMAELEQRVDRFSPPGRVAFPAQMRDHFEKDNGL